MLTRTELQGLNVGDVVEAGSILPGLTKEPVALKMTAAEDGVFVEFVATYFGVTLGKVKADVSGETVKWEM